MTNSDDGLCLLTEDRPVFFEFFLDGTAVSAMPGESVLAACQRTGVALATVCKGRGICGACRVTVEDKLDALPPASAQEVRLIGYLGRGEDTQTHRLACQIAMAESLTGLRLKTHPVVAKS
jgi:ferredoxin